MCLGVVSGPRPSEPSPKPFPTVPSLSGHPDAGKGDVSLRNLPGRVKIFKIRFY